MLDALLRKFGGGPVGLSTLAVAVGEEPETVEVVAEPFLVRQGLLARTPRGRVATAAAWAHLGMTPPPDAFGAHTFRLITEGCNHFKSGTSPRAGTLLRCRVSQQLAYTPWLGWLCRLTG